MIGYFILILLISIVVSIATEQFVIRSLPLSEGVEITKGRCRLKSGYGLLENVAPPKVVSQTYEPPDQVNNDLLMRFYKPLK